MFHGTSNHGELDFSKFCNDFEAIHKDLGGYGSNKLDLKDSRPSTSMMFNTLSSPPQQDNEIE